MYDVTPITSPHETDCGATCLKMLLDYYAVTADLNDLTEGCRTGIFGCKASDIKRVGNAKGLDIKAFRMDWEELICQDRPAIIWWKHDHFCVFCGMDEKENVIVNNPDTGRYRVPITIFRFLYAGVAMFNGTPENTEAKLLPERVSDLSLVADMALVNSEIALALMEVM